MKKSIAILVAIHSLAYQGERILGNKWLNFLDAFRRRLQQNGFEDNDSTDELLIFTYNHPHAAINSILSSIDRTKTEFGWEVSHGDAPLQIVMHLEEKGKNLPELREPTSNIWEGTRQESIHITRNLKQHWETMMTGRQVPDFTFKSEGVGLYRMQFSSKTPIQTEQIFPYRQLPLAVGKQECFYCGMTNHKPGGCPSRLLTIDIKGSDVGYMPLSKISTTYKEIFSNLDQIVAILKKGVKPSQVRKNEILQVTAAYFDIFRLFQVRFLRHIAFSSHSKWASIDKTDKQELNCRSLLLGLDCLRVSQHSQAEELFFEEIRSRGKKQFYSTVGLAFCALEKGKSKDFGHFLERAATLANLEKDRIYIRLLLSRYHDLNDNLFKAEEALREISAIFFDCYEAQYRKVQLAARTGFKEEDFRNLRSLIVGKKECFIISMMDPSLIGVHGLMEDLLSNQVQTMSQSAFENLTQARVEQANLVDWFGADDPQVHKNEQTLASMEKQYARKSYYDIFDVTNKSKALVLTCNSYKREKKEKFKEQIRKVANRWEFYNEFWNNYPFQYFFRTFYTALLNTRKKLSQVEILSQKNSGAKFRAALTGLQECVEELKNLKSRQLRMLSLSDIIHGVKFFAKRLVISEFAIACLGILIFPIGSRVFGGGGGLAEKMADPATQKQVMFISLLFLAPLISLALTLWKMRDE